MERRTIQTKFEIKAAEDGKESRAIGGVAAVVETPTVLWQDTWNGKTEKFIEVIQRGAFDDVLNDDVRALFNHNSEKVLGRTSAGTLKIHLNERGDLGYDVPDVPDTTFGNDLLVNIKRNEINQSSFGFNVKEDKWETIETETEVTYTRTIIKFSELADVSPVTFPAYESTVTEMRSATEGIVKELREKLEQPAEDPDDDLAAKVEAEQKYLKLRLAINKNK